MCIMEPNWEELKQQFALLGIDIDKKREEWKSLTLSNDFVFSNVMQRTDLSKYFLENLLDKRIVKINATTMEKFFQSIQTGKYCRLDLFIKDDKGINYDIECQARDKEDYYIPLRQRYYHSSMDIASLNPGQTFVDLPRSFVIFICTFDFCRRGSVIYDFPYKLCSSVDDLKMDDGQRTIILYSKGEKNRSSLHPDISNFLDFFNGSAPVGDFTKAVAEEVYKVKSNKIAEGFYMQYSLAMQDAQILGEKIGEKRGRDAREKELIFSMFKKNRTIDDILNFVDFEKNKILEYKKEYDQIITKL